MTATLSGTRQAVLRLMVVAVAVGVLAGWSASPSAAFACKPGGVDIEGQGEAVLNTAFAGVWGPDFSKSDCTPPPTVTVNFTPTANSLGPWATTECKLGAASAFIGTLEPPNLYTKVEEIERYCSATGLLTTPVEQESIVVLVHLPANCTATSTPANGRLVFDYETLEQIFDGQITAWNQIADAGDTVSGTGCDSATPIETVVPLAAAGTTHAFKRFLSQINPGLLTTEDGSFTWAELSERPLSTVWPSADAAIRPVEANDSAEVSAVKSTASSIGFAGLVDARPVFGGDTGTATFWAEVQNNGTSAHHPKFADPSTNKESSTVANANCNKTAYANVPTSRSDVWNEVVAKLKQKHYPICALFYMLTFPEPIYPPGVGTTVENFTEYVTSTAAHGGQKMIVGHDY